jgi:general stress protein YciG
MAGNKVGGKKAALTNKTRHGSDFYARIGGKGGSKKVPKGFALNRDLARKAGAVGGSRSRRTKKVIAE